MMKLQIKTTNLNGYAIRGVLIVSESPVFWIQEIQKMGFDLAKIKVYPIPNTTPNSIYGCLVVSPVGLDKIDPGRNQLLQLVNEKLFIPAYATVYPSMTENDWGKLFKNKHYFLHPAVGFVALEEEVIWEELVCNENQINVSIVTPADSVYIPQQINSFIIDMPIEDLASALNPNPGLINGELPFDLRKVLEGNNKEVEKFLAFMEKNPSLALQYAIPLDVLGSSRGKDWAKFKFGEKHFFEDLSSNFREGYQNLKTKYFDDNISYIYGMLFTAVILFACYFMLDSNTSKPISQSQIPHTAVAPINNIPPSGSSGAASSPESDYSWIFTVVAFGITAGILYIIIKKSQKTKSDLSSKKTPENSSPVDSFIPAMIDWDNINTSQNESKYYLGDNELSPIGKVMLILCFVGLSYYYFKPLWSILSFFNLFSIISFLLIAKTLYNLFRRDKFILKPEEEDTQTFEGKSFSAFIVFMFFKFLFIIYSTFSKNNYQFGVSIALFFCVLFLVGLIITSIFDKSDKTENSSKGNSYVDNDKFDMLQKKYIEIADNFIKNKDYSKAAYIYLKLLNQPYKAANILKDGKQYALAATIFIKNCQNKLGAAECYELGNMLPKAIELYKEIGQVEKVGDLYRMMRQEDLAMKHYQLKLDDYIKEKSYIKAAILSKEKMYDIETAQSILMRGWRENISPYNSLNCYFANILDVDILKKEIYQVFQNETNPKNMTHFFNILKHEYTKDATLQSPIKELAYEIAVKHLGATPHIISELDFYNKNDANFKKDIFKFKLFKNKR